MAECLSTAVDEHSGHRPLVRFYDFRGNGNYDYDLPPDWIPQFSIVQSIEYPAGRQNREMIDQDNYEIIWSGVGWKLRFLSATPSATETIRLEYTTTHRVTNDADTVRRDDFSAVSILAAAWSCFSLAARYATTQEPTLSADVVDYRSKSDEYTRLENVLRKRYFQAIGGAADEKGPRPAFLTRDLDTKFADQTDYLTHSRRYR